MVHALDRARPVVLACSVAALLAASGCAATRGEPAQDGSPPPAPEVAIVGLHEEPAYDASLVKLVGTIVNRGSEPIERATVRVEARDAQGRAMTRVLVPSSPETIPPGGAATFAVDVPRSTAVHDYHAEVVRQ